MNLRRLSLGLACILLGLVCLGPVVAVVQVAFSPGAGLSPRALTVSFGWGRIVLAGWKAWAGIGSLGAVSLALLGCGVLQLRKMRRRTE